MNYCACERSDPRLPMSSLSIEAEARAKRRARNGGAAAAPDASTAASNRRPPSQGRPSPPPAVLAEPSDAPSRLAYLAALGQRARTLRARRGMTRKAVALAAGVSERHLANLELGVGNASILVLAQVAAALQCSVAELVGDVTTSSPEWLLLRDLLERRDDATLKRVREAAVALLGADAGGAATRARRIALVGLRGAGKSTLGPMLAEALDLPFVELGREIELTAGCSIGEIQALYGAHAYRRYERRALDETIRSYDAVVVATPGGIVSDPATFGRLLDACTTVWLRSSAEDHMRRVAAQGDLRPMAASREAMADLKTILAGREAFYAKAAIHVDTSAGDLATTFATLRTRVDEALRGSAA